MFQGEKMMTSLLAVMITFGTQAVGKLGKRLSGWQPLSVSCCHRERANARTSDASLHAALCLTAASAAQEPGRSREGRVMGKVVFEVSCHVRDRDEVGDGVRMHACQSNIYWKRMNTGTNSRKKRHRKAHRMSPKQCPFKTRHLALII